MKKTGFTLAEILVSLLILGVIASLTIPSLIQNTQKKEEVVKIKKGLSVLNQAISMDKALTGNDLSQYTDVGDLFNMFKKRMSVVDSTPGGQFFKTQDGLGYYIHDVYQYDDTVPDRIFDTNSSLTSSWNSYITIFLCTKSGSALENYVSVGGGADLPANTLDMSIVELNGWYTFFCGYDRCVPAENTAKIINASDPTKIDSAS